jgi:hypothetical protein
MLQTSKGGGVQPDEHAILPAIDWGGLLALVSQAILISFLSRKLFCAVQARRSAAVQCC